MMPTEDDRAAVIKIAELLEDMATKLEIMMPTVRKARATLSDISPDAARFSGFEGSVDEFDMAAAEEFGYNRVEVARARIADAVRDVEDEIPRPLT